LFNKAGGHCHQAITERKQPAVARTCSATCFTPPLCNSVVSVCRRGTFLLQDKFPISAQPKHFGEPNRYQAFSLQGLAIEKTEQRTTCFNHSPFEKRWTSL
jgi:hypothetical protein